MIMSVKWIYLQILFLQSFTIIINDKLLGSQIFPFPTLQFNRKEASKAAS